MAIEFPAHHGGRWRLDGKHAYSRTAGGLELTDRSEHDMFVQSEMRERTDVGLTKAVWKVTNALLHLSSHVLKPCIH